MSGRIPAVVFPPGEFVRDEIDARGWTQNDLAEILGRPVRLVNEIISGKRAITPETASGLAEAFGTEAQFWMNLESGYQLSKIQITGSDVARRAEIYSVAPLKDMIRRGWIKDQKTTVGIEQELVAYFGVSTVAEIADLKVQASARKSTSYEAETSPAERAWLCRVKRIASTLKVSPYRKDAFGGLLAELKLLLPNGQDVSRVPPLLAKYGIRFLIVEHMSKTRFDGVALWLDPARPVVAISLRMDRVDYFWFTLLHELGHIFHEDDQEWVDSNIAGDATNASDSLSGREKKANEFAKEFLVPKKELDTFIKQVGPFYSRIKISQFAERMRVHPGIVVGQLQWLHQIPYSQGRDMLLKVRDTAVQAAITDGWGHLPEDRMTSPD